MLYTSEAAVVSNRINCIFNCALEIYFRIRHDNFEYVLSVQ